MTAGTPGGLEFYGCEGLVVTLRPGFLGRLDFEAQDAISIFHAEAARAPLKASFGASSGATIAAGIEPDQVMIAPPGMRVGLEATAPCGLLQITLDRTFYADMARAEALRPAPIAECAISRDPYLLGLGHIFAVAFQLEKAPATEFLQSLARSLSSYLARAYGQAHSGRGGRGLSPQRLGVVMDMIEGELATSLSIARLAASVQLSEFHFCRMFRHATGHSPRAFITMRRMDLARQLLWGTDKPLAEVAGAVGYRTHAYFTSVFHLHVGMPPGQYRRLSMQRTRPAVAPAAELEVRPSA
jgi:AraC family transcriptional regulator